MSQLVPFGPEFWTTEGPVISVFTYPYLTRMAVIRLSAGTLFVWSPISLNDVLRAEVDALGKVAHLVSPNFFHHLWLGEWKQAYPRARLYASPGLPRRRRDLTFDRVLGDHPEPAWAGDIDQVAMQGNILLTEIVFSYPGVGYLIYNAVLNLDYPLMQALFFFITMAILIANLFADIAYVFLDPRVRVGE